MLIIPQVKMLNVSANEINLEHGLLHPNFSHEINKMYEILNIKQSPLGLKTDISFDENFKDGEYHVDLQKNSLQIKAKCHAALFSALQTIKQILSWPKKHHKSLKIVDFPDISKRGFMLDISRTKIPKLSVILELIDMLSALKINHFELYVEGFSFEYLSFKKYLIDNGYITLKEYLILENYCLDRYIDFVPNQNGFGHMTDWLKQSEFKHLCECKDGIYLWGRNRPPSTLNPLDNDSVKLVSKMYHDMLPHTKSKFFNMNFDEPFELGLGLSKQMCDLEGKGMIYVDFVNKIYPLIKKYQKTPLIWADVLNNHLDVLQYLPDDLVFIDWGYDGNYPFNKTIGTLKKTNRAVYAAPGTSSWSSFAGRINESLENITNAINAVNKYHADGIILTDWGDFGHLQYSMFSYIPIVFFAFKSYNNEEMVLLKVKNFVNQQIFKDTSSLMYDALFSLGNYNNFLPNMSNGTRLFYTFMWASAAMSENNQVEFFKAKMIGGHLPNKTRLILKNYFAFCSKIIKQVNIFHKDKLRFIKEYQNTILILSLILSFDEATDETTKSSRQLFLLNSILRKRDSYLNSYKALWNKQNKSGTLFLSMKHLTDFFDYCALYLNYLQINEIS